MNIYFKYFVDCRRTKLVIFAFRFSFIEQSWIRCKMTEGIFISEIESYERKGFILGTSKIQMLLILQDGRILFGIDVSIITGGNA